MVTFHSSTTPGKVPSGVIGSTFVNGYGGLLDRVLDLVLDGVLDGVGLLFFQRIDTVRLKLWALWKIRCMWVETAKIAARPKRRS